MKKHAYKTLLLIAICIFGIITSCTNRTIILPLPPLSDEEGEVPNIMNLVAVQEGTHIKFSWTYPTTGNISGYEIYIEGQETPIYKSDNVNSTSWIFDATGKPNGTYTFTFYTTDINGNKSSGIIYTFDYKYDESESNIPVVSIELNKKVLNLAPGRSEALIATILPEEATNKDILWSSSDETVALVEDGKITALSEGTTIITAASKSNPEINATCDIIVSEKTLTVEFYNSYSGTSNYIYVEYGKTVAIPDIPHQTGYFFTGWTHNFQPFDFDTPITEDIVLKANWSSQFTDDNGFTYSFADSWENAAISDYKGTGKNIKIPADIQGYPITNIRISAFEGCTDLESINLSECTNLQVIEISAFSNCTSLKSIDITGCSKLESIEMSAFEDCTNLREISLNRCNNLKTIGNNAFEGCSSLIMINLSGLKSLEKIGIDAFENCSSLEKIDLSDCIKLIEIGFDSFVGCENLNTIDISNTGFQTIPTCFQDTPIVSIDMSNCIALKEVRNFDGCTSLKSVNLTGCTNLQTIGIRAFADCSLLESFIIPESVTVIDDFAFYNCTKLSEMNIPANVRTIGTQAFSMCTGLTFVNMTEGLETIGDFAFYKCTGLTKIRIPGSVNSIGDNAFSYCSGLQICEIGDGVSTIYKNAFSDCSNLNCFIPDSVLNIEHWAFTNCKTLYCEAASESSGFEESWSGAHNTEPEIYWGKTLEEFRNDFGTI